MKIKTRLVIVFILLFSNLLFPIWLNAGSTAPSLPGQGTRPGTTFPTSGSNPTGAVNTSANSFFDRIKGLAKVPWGGFSVVVLPLCNDPTTVWIEFNPFFIGSVPSPAGALLFDLKSLGDTILGKLTFGFSGLSGRGGGTAKVYAYFTAGLPLEWYLGFFKPIPGVAAVVNPAIIPPCLTLPYFGTITDVGTGMP